MNAKPTKEMIVAMLYAWIKQRPGLDFGNYGDVANYRQESRRITRQLADARQLLRAVELASGLTADNLIEAFPHAYSGRLSLELHSDGKTWSLSYCTGQYWPTEYRAAACAVLASALWNHRRFQSMPAPTFTVYCLDDYEWTTREDAEAYAQTVAKSRRPEVRELYKGKTAGDWIRSSFRREFGANIQKRWFD